MQGGGLDGKKFLVMLETGDEHLLRQVQVRGVKIAEDGDRMLHEMGHLLQKRGGIRTLPWIPALPADNRLTACSANRCIAAARSEGSTSTHWFLRRSTYFPAWVTGIFLGAAGPSRGPPRGRTPATLKETRSDP